MAKKDIVQIVLGEWLAKCSTKDGASRSTVAMGIVVLNHLRAKCPLELKDVFSERGEVKGARSGLSAILEKYDLPAKYLGEVTTRAGHPEGRRLFEALEYGNKLTSMSAQDRDESLLKGIRLLVAKARDWLNRQHLKLHCDRQSSPISWIGNILTEAKGRSGGKVEQHLVGAKLACRHPDLDVPNNPGHAGDVQTGRPGDFVVGSTAYHVTVAPGSKVIENCVSNIGAGLHPVLLVPRDQCEKAKHLAEDQSIANRITILSIEDFVSVNIIEMSKGQHVDFVNTLRSIITTYNDRLEEVETDMSLKIELE